MSRYVISALHAPHKVTVGYDPPLSTLFAYVEDVTITDQTTDPFIFQVGQHLGAIPDVETLARQLAPYARIPLDVLIHLRADQLVPYQRSALQEQMVQCVARRMPQD